MLYIGIKSCQQDVKSGANQAIRDTWLKRLPGNVGHMFYVGGIPRVSLVTDEAYVDAGDGYGKGESNGHEHLPKKTLEILKDFLTTNAGHLFICDTDVYVVPKLLMECGFENFDYSGVFSPIYPIGVCLENFKDNLGQIITPFYNYASTHACFFSRYAAETIIKLFPSTKPHWADDLMIGQALGPLIASGKISVGDLTIENSAVFHMNNSSQKCGRVSPADWMRIMQTTVDLCEQ